MKSAMFFWEFVTKVPKKSQYETNPGKKYFLLHFGLFDI